MTYEEFRTGFTFTEVRRMLALEQHKARENGNYVFVTRKTVLGRWHQLKQQMYKEFEDAEDEQDRDFREG